MRPRRTPEQSAGGWATTPTARLAAGRSRPSSPSPTCLRGAGLSAPEIIAVDAASGLAVLEDLGDDLFARLIEDGEPAAPLYLAAVEALARLHLNAAMPDVLSGPGGDWPLLTYDATALQGGADLFARVAAEAEPGAGFRRGGAGRMGRGVGARSRPWARRRRSVVAHRDYHAENLIWLPERTGDRRGSG